MLRGLVVRGLLPLAVLAAGGGLSAQEGATGTVLGTVTDRDTGTPLTGAFVTLLDREGVRRGAALTDESGRFVLRAPAPGSYRLRAERIGAEGVLSDFFDITPGQVVVANLSTRPSAVSLAGVEVTGESRCDLRGASGSATVRLWEEARKALEVAEWVDDVGYVYETVSWERVLDADARRVLEEQTTSGIQVGRGAFRSLEAELLMERGFVQEDDSGKLYYAPDAAVLLSDEFLAAHCFRAVREGGATGLAFDPAPGRRVPDIAGTLWLTAEGGLDRLEYRYTSLPGELRGSTLLGGEIRFFRLDEGAWIVREWRIRMPRRMEAVPGANGLMRIRLESIQEVGGQVRTARRAARVEAVFGAGTGALRGVLRGGDGAAIPGAQVFLSGTGYAAVSAEDGSFLLERVRPGVYTLVSESSGTALGAPPRPMEVEVLADSVGVVSVSLPGPDDVLAGRCLGQPPIPLDPPDFREDGGPAVLGGVVLDADGGILAEWPVRVRWIRPSLEAGGVVREDWRGTVVFSDAWGGWAVCGLPADVAVVVETARTRLTRADASAGGGRWDRVERVGIMGPGDLRWVEVRPWR